MRCASSVDRLAADAASACERRCAQLGAGAGQRTARPAGEVDRPFCNGSEQDNFTFLGLREFELVRRRSKPAISCPSRAAGLGVLRDAGVQVLRRGTELVAMTPEVRRFFFAPAPLIITKANVMSRVHRRAHMDYIGIKTYRRDGTPKGEIRLVGLFTSQAYVQLARARSRSCATRSTTVLAAIRLSARQP